MKKVLVGLILGIFLISSVGYAAMPKYISVQGRLSDSEGPVSGAYDFYFKIDNDAAGCPSPVWYNERENINLDNGVFNILIGSSKAINDSFDGPRYLCIAVKKHGESSYDWFSTSVPVSSSGYAYTASGADAFDVRNDLSVSGNAMVNGDLKVLTDSGFEMIFTGTNDVNIQSPAGFYLYTSGATSNPGFSILTNGNVGIGTATPAYKLDVTGNSRFTGGLTVNGIVVGTGGVIISGNLDFTSNLRPNGAACAAGQVLKADASGVIRCGTDQTGTGGGTGTYTNVYGSTAITSSDTDGPTTTISHVDTSSQSSSDNSGATVIQDVTLDTYGHVTGLATATVAAASHTHSYLPLSGGNLVGHVTVAPGYYIYGDVNGHIYPTNMRSGTTPATLSGGYYCNTYITFSPNFASAPNLVLTPESSSTSLSCRIVAKSTSAATITCINSAGGCTNLAYSLNWIAFVN